VAYKGAPGLYSDEQVTGWKRITDAVHAKGGYIFTQLWHAGRTTHIAVTGEEPVTASVDPAYWANPNYVFVVTPDGFSQPSPHRALKTAEIHGIIEQYRIVAVNAKRRCIDWLQRLERGETVIVNLRLDTDVETEFVRFDRPRVVRVLERIAADLDNLSLVPDDPQADREVNQNDPQARHRRELAEPSREPTKLSQREQRTALRAELGLSQE
jgi:hypothetical protein